MYAVHTRAFISNNECDRKITKEKTDKWNSIMAVLWYIITYMLWYIEVYSSMESGINLSKKFVQIFDGGKQWGKWKCNYTKTE